MSKEGSPYYSVIISTLNEEDYLAGVIQSVRRELTEAEILVVDGGSNDKTLNIANNIGDKVISSPPGRGHQCQLGAKAAKGQVLIFLHGDTLFPR